MKMQKPDSVKCENCIFYKLSSGYYQMGLCRFNPPTVVMSSIDISKNENIAHHGASSTSSGGGMFTPNYTSKHPETSPTDWCGRFVAQDNLTAVEWVARKKGLLEDAKVQE